ncbi:dehydratase [Amycolatopsis tolypomycina]|uniref:Dehydratase n=1 Tax=Amycolatopsis tolypomycina TaxID=208445 RepID=A0A1H4ZI65_9PSEU|nr:cyclase [Amycolatopsis tolypomycina]SED29936.1 dehydratase [Amycolatopsis tolypomycina]
MKALHFSRLAALTAAAVLPIALAAPASAATSVTFDCQANAPIVGPQKVALNQDADVSAPATVAPSAAFDVVIDPAPNTVPSEVSGNKVKNINTFALKIPIPANSSYVGATLSGGSGLGSTPPAISVANGVATLSFPGPIAGGATFELPTVTAHLTAGQSGTIQTKLGGTSYTDPGLTFKAVASTIIGDLTAPTACFPNPSPVFTTTTIG